MTNPAASDKAPTARQRARTQITAEILAAARLRLTKQGPGELSLRAVARDVGMVSSAIYRYFSSRDELLTALLVVAYNELGETVERADASVTGRDNHAERWTTTCRAVRTWAIEHPGDYALLYGSPVPGYSAPQDTIEAATRGTLVLVRIVLDAQTSGPTITLDANNADESLEITMQGALDFLDQLDASGAAVTPEIAFRLVAAWSALFGSISFELFGHLVGSVNDNERYFDQIIDRLAGDLGLRDNVTSTSS